MDTESWGAAAMNDEIPENYTNLDHALRLFEASEAPFYDAMRYFKQATADLSAAREPRAVHNRKARAENHRGTAVRKLLREGRTSRRANKLRGGHFHRGHRRRDSLLAMLRQTRTEWRRSVIVLRGKPGDVKHVDNLGTGPVEIRIVAIENGEVQFEVGAGKNDAGRRSCCCTDLMMLRKQAD
ncbi:MAG: hypothetical protein MZW92_31995 [Comamonadaceae bacterium]|nr:hypothetical protein [Comamonadaceae bacterium]